MVFCRKCGADMGKDARYCPKCGLDNQAQTLIPEKVELDIGQRTGDLAEKAMSQFWKAWWFIAICGVVALFLFLMIGFLVFRSFAGRML